jgi:hypothetical protein
VGRKGRVIGMHTFGASAPLKELQRKFGFELERVDHDPLQCDRDRGPGRGSEPDSKRTPTDSTLRPTVNDSGAEQCALQE